MESKAGRLEINKSYISKESILNLLIGLVLFCSTFVATSHFTAYCSLVCVVVFYCFLFINRPIIIIKYLHFIFGSTAAIIGCAAIEFFDIRLIEINDHSYFRGALPLLIFSWWIFLTTLSIHDTWLSRKMDIKESQQNYAVDDIFADRSPNTGYIIYMASVIGCALVLYTFATVFKNPSFALGVDRFDYANMFDYGSIYGKALRLIKYLLVLCIVLAIYKNNKIGWLALVVYCMHSLWTGNKFGSIFSLLCTFLMIYSQKIETRIEQLKKMIILVMATLIVLIGVAVFAASFTRDEGAYGYLLPRVAQQSQLWWKTYDKSRHYHMHEFRDEIKSIRKGEPEIGKNVGAKYGIYKIMYYTTPKTKVDIKLSSGSRYTEAGFAAAYYYFGKMGCVLFAVIGGILASIFVNYFLYYLRYGQYVRAFIHIRFYTNLTVFMSMFIFFPYFNRTSILSYLILVFGYNKLFIYGQEQI